jgi:alkanesulfonate monooxygenase SsuD/methylene tetrahydromethanopterin reductase-like flavin-dependent oxidoreductase (luciferase family)
MVGGSGEKRTLRTLARFGDIANIGVNSLEFSENFKHKWEVIEQHCKEFGRDPSEIKKTVVVPLRVEKDEKKAVQLRKQHEEWFLYGTIPFINDRIQQYIDAGAEEIIFSGIVAKAELFEEVKEEVISVFS